MLKKQIEIQGSGRTDRAVHCTKQFAHFDCEKLPFEKTDFMHKLNAFLPPDIAINGIYAVLDNAHARFDAHTRMYEYVICTHKTTFFKDMSYLFRKKLNLELMREAAVILLSNDDFTSFSKLHSASETNICTLKKIDIIEDAPNLRFHIAANRFLRGMVRLLVGTLLEIGLEKMTINDLKNLIAFKDVRKTPAAMPAEGLFLVNVIYPEHIFLDEKPSQEAVLLF
jgi:tRNA pseudouridine38-40 synthase